MLGLQPIHISKIVLREKDYQKQTHGSQRGFSILAVHWLADCW